MVDTSYTVATALFCLMGMVVLVGMLMLALAIKIVPEEKRLAVYRLGRYVGEKGPGIVLLIPIIDRGVTVEAGAQIKEVLERRSSWTAIGEAITQVYTDGTVEISGERWSATSRTPLSAGAKVRVTRVILEVERV